MDKCVSVTKRFPRVILATACLPWRMDWSLDEDRFRKEVHFLAEHFSRTLYIFGTAGEGYAVNREQFMQVVRVFHQACKEAGAHPMVGLINLSLSEIQKRIEFCLEQGLGAFQLSFPSWGTLNDEEVLLFFEETCGRYPEAIFLHYNLKRVGRRLEATHYAEISRKHANLVAVKHTNDSNERLKELVEAAPELRFFVGDRQFCEMRDELDIGLLPSIGMVVAEKTRAIFEGADFDRTRHLENLATASRAVHQAADARGAHIDGCYDKHFYKFHDRDFPLRLLPPYSYCTEEQFEGFVERLPEEWKQ